ncbi:MAG: carboxylesterase/lipase family protein [Actinomycetota bacterium]|nr:carboxylesterase/lipase family protein [Actinomycetota bacterium]
MDTIVATRSGRVQGVERAGVVAFKGIPFAAPPFGPRRMRPPEPHEPWDGVRDASAYGATAPHGPYPAPYDLLLPEPVIPGEDCLNLNVWTPDPAAAGLPVLVWIHGGAFANGSGAVPTYDGSAFARDDVVAVTINYRLGADGFLYTGDGIANVGMLDQVAALEWVRGNIAAFGGDPDRVTIAGESAGGYSVSTLLAMPAARGLFAQAIVQSGAGHFVLSPETATKVAGYLAAKLEVEPTREGLASVPVDALLQAQALLSAEAWQVPDPGKWGEIALNRMIFEPVVDGRVLPGRPIDLVAAGASAEIPVLTGSNAEEMRLFMVPNGLVDFVNDDLLNGALAMFGLPAEQARAAYDAEHPGSTPGELLADVSTDWTFRIPTVRMAEGHGGPTYVYEFAWRTKQYDGRLGACHALEIPFVFDNLGAEGGEALETDSPPQSLADTMHGAWVRFVSTGDPGWPAYGEARNVMRFDDSSELVQDPGSATRALWEGVR